MSRNVGENNERTDQVFGSSKSSNFADGFKRKKDPKNMTSEELDEYINKNKNNKSLNSSFQTHNNLNYSFTSGGQNLESGGLQSVNIDSNRLINFGTKGQNTLNKEARIESNYIDSPNKKFGLNYNYSNINNPFLINNNNITTNNKNNKQSLMGYDKEYLNTNNSNISYDPMLDGEDKYLKFKSKVLPPSSSNNNLINPNISNSTNIATSSNATNNYIKALQEKNKILLTENEELKQNFVAISELLEQERAEFQKKLINEINKTTELENTLKNELNNLEKENKNLANEVNEYKIKISIMNTNISILENEKGRHLEQNAVDKENLQSQIDCVIEENEENKKRLISVNNENSILREKLTKDNEDKTNLEKSIQILKEENQTLKNEYKNNTNAYFVELENSKRKYDEERQDLVGNIKSLKEIIKQQEYDKKEMAKKYERNLRELTYRLNRLELTTNGKKPQVPTFSPKSSKLKSGLSKSRSKDKLSKLNNDPITLSMVSKNNIYTVTTDRELKSSKNSSVGTKKKHVNRKSSMSNNSYYDLEIEKSPKSTKSKSKKKTGLKKKIGSSDKNILKMNNESTLSAMSPRGMLSSINNSSIDNINTINSNFIQSPVNFNNHNLISRNNTYEDYKTKSKYNESKTHRLNQINDTIFDLERNIADLNRNYKNLMIKLNTSINAEEATNLKRNINIIANNLQDQSEKLIDMKNEQQLLLKNSLLI